MKITIARQCGSGGHEVAEALAEKLNLEIFDKKRFVEEAKKRNVYDENANFLNEKPIDSFSLQYCDELWSDKSERPLY